MRLEYQAAACKLGREATTGGGVLPVGGRGASDPRARWAPRTREPTSRRVRGRASDLQALTRGLPECASDLLRHAHAHASSESLIFQLPRTRLSPRPRVRAAPPRRARTRLPCNLLGSLTYHYASRKASPHDVLARAHSNDICAASERSERDCPVQGREDFARVEGHECDGREHEELRRWGVCRKKGRQVDRRS